MSGSVFQPILILGVPESHEVDPQAWEALKRHAADEYGAGVILNVGGTPDATARPQLLGDWQGQGRSALAELALHIDAYRKGVF